MLYLALRATNISSAFTLCFEIKDDSMKTIMTYIRIKKYEDYDYTKNGTILKVSACTYLYGEVKTKSDESNSL